VSLENKAEPLIRAYRIDELGNITEDQIEAD
jgi:hypothetical protein